MDDQGPARHPPWLAGRGHDPRGQGEAQGGDDRIQIRVSQVASQVGVGDGLEPTWITHPGADSADHLRGISG